MLTILFDGVAYGMLLFVLASGLSVTLGLMNFINLAHGAFAMVGGYVTALLMNARGRPVPRHAAAAFLIAGACSGSRSSERSTGASTARAPLDQVLFTIGLVLMAMPIADFLLGDRAAAGRSAGMALRQPDGLRRRDQPLSPFHRRRLRGHRRRCCRSSWSGLASARN